MAQPIDILLVSDTLQSINVAWRHFAFTDYSAKATTHVNGAMECIRGDTPPKAVVYYASDDSAKLFRLYRAMRADERLPDLPLIVLADPQRQKALAETVTMKNTTVLGISIDDKRLLAAVRSMIK